MRRWFVNIPGWGAIKTVLSRKSLGFWLAQLMSLPKKKKKTTADHSARQTRKVVREVKYPSPLGFVSVSAKEINDYWGDVKLEDVLDSDTWETFYETF